MLNCQIKFHICGPNPAQQYYKDLVQETVKSNASVKVCSF